MQSWPRFNPVTSDGAGFEQVTRIVQLFGSIQSLSRVEQNVIWLLIRDHDYNVIATWSQIVLLYFELLGHPINSDSVSHFHKTDVYNYIDLIIGPVNVTFGNHLLFIRKYLWFFLKKSLYFLLIKWNEDQYYSRNDLIFHLHLIYSQFINNIQAWRLKIL